MLFREYLSMTSGKIIKADIIYGSVWLEVEYIMIEGAKAHQYNS